VGAAAGVAPEQAEESHVTEVFWERRNWWSASASAACKAIDAVAATATASCRARMSSYACTREAGHPGRHMAQGMTMVVAAWPGGHEPTLADLGDTQVASR
jgi:hypothetical protein